MTRRREIRLSADALRDLGDICDYIAEHDSLAKSEHVMDRLLEVIDSLETNPMRGGHPRELLATGLAGCRQVFFKPYRVVYVTGEAIVHILLIADGRRDLRTLLAQRLLGA
jgi:toxin ParE1/3/4